MYINVTWHNGKYPSFNVDLSSKEGADPFLTIKGCKIMHGTNGEFVSWPATKNQQTGKYWNHVYANEKFSEVVMTKAKESMPKEEKQKERQRSRDDDDDSDLPF